MKWLLLLCQLHLISGQMSSSCPHQCSCYGAVVDCSRRSLSTSSLPTRFPSGTMQLFLHNNRLSMLPNGYLDHLPDLQTVTLYNNPWACDCGILYLRAWLLRHPPTHTSHLHVNCSSPAPLSGRLVVFLTEEELLESCNYWYCDLAVFTQASLLVFALLQGALLVAVIIFLRRFEKISEAARRSKDSLTTGEGHAQNEYESLSGI